MSLYRSGIADILIIAATIIAQILIARRFFSVRKKLPRLVAWALTCFLSLLWAILVFGTLFRFPALGGVLRWMPATDRSALVAIGNIWGMTAVASFAVYAVYNFFASRGGPVYSPERRTLIQTVGAVAAAAPFAVAAYGAFIERTNFQMKEIDLPIPNLHPDLEGLRIGQLSDLHVSPWLSVRDAGRAVDMLNEMKPYLTVITGDVITQVGDPLDGAIRELGRLRADAAVLGCLGNHERYVQCQGYETRESAKRGIGILRNESRLIRRGNGVLNVAGVDFQTLRDGAYLRDAEKLVVPGVANLLLSHNPDVFPVAVRKGYDAVMSGHTHGGQVTVEILNQTLNMARFVTPYVAGLYRIEGRSCYVTAGIGTIALPVRIGAPPEITVVRLTRA